MGLLPTVACPASVHGEAGKSIAPPNRQWTNFDRVMDSDVAYHYWVNSNEFRKQSCNLPTAIQMATCVSFWVSRLAVGSRWCWQYKWQKSMEACSPCFHHSCSISAYLYDLLFWYGKITDFRYFKGKVRQAPLVVFCTNQLLYSGLVMFSLFEWRYGRMVPFQAPGSKRHHLEQ